MSSIHRRAVTLDSSYLKRYRQVTTQGVARLPGDGEACLARERLDCGVDARRERNADGLHREFGRGEAAQQHRLVEVAEMADAEDLAGERAEAAAEREVEAVEGGLAHGVGGMALRHQDGGHRVGEAIHGLAVERRALAVGSPR